MMDLTSSGRTTEPANRIEVLYSEQDVALVCQ